MSCICDSFMLGCFDSFASALTDYNLITYRSANERLQKKVDNHKAPVALHFGFYNFCQLHGTLRVTPAMEAGITDHVWDVKELLA